LFSFLLNFVVERLHYIKRECIFSTRQTLQNIFPPKYALKCPKKSAAVI